MSVVKIYLTDPAAEQMDDFVHNDQRFVFAHLTHDGPGTLIEGPMWAFIDWVLDTMAGFEMCRRLRADPRTKSAHITMVLEADDPEDRRRALKAGADDYMLGPLDRTKVLDRIMAIDPQLRRSHATQRFEVGDLAINVLGMQARWAGKPLILPPNEFRLLRFLAENPDRVLTRSELIAGLGKQEGAIDARTVDVWMGRLRRALSTAGAGANNPLRTVRSQGYVFQSP